MQSKRKQTNSSHAAFYGAVTLSLLAFGGCGMSLTALSSGSSAPAIAASGWTNGEEPTDLDGKVVVLEMFATW